jgi:hypothetical protein
MVSGFHLNLGCLMDLVEEGGEVGGEMDSWRRQMTGRVETGRERERRRRTGGESEDEAAACC